MPKANAMNAVPETSVTPSADATPEQLARAYQVVADATKAASSNFYYAFVTLPPDKRNSVYAGYAFCRLADDIVDEGEYGDAAGEALDSLRVKLADAYDGRADGDMWIALGDTLRRYPIDQRHLLDVVEGCRMDLDRATYETFDDLVKYCKLVASATGLALIEVFGYEDERAVEYATDLGIALQLTNILRDITEDLEIGRVYLPAAELAEYGVSVDDLRDKRVTPEFRRFMKFQVERARKYLASGVRLFPLLDRQSRSCPETMVSVYETLLDQIEKYDYDVLNNRVGLSKFQKFRLLATIWLRGRGFRFL
ncbi:MAG: squalene/phytoene synthase family protein [Chloroflexi bacterium]|nr:squalene/phytoene synthase family protein [Chloroflexota bacterium]